MQKAFFIDDDKSAAVYTALLAKADPGGLEIEFVQPNVALLDLAHRILTSKVQLLILDYRLDENPADNANANRYKAGPLAQQLRDHAIDAPEDDLPIVLLSNEENIKKLFKPDQTAHDLFDDKHTKQALRSEPEPIRMQLLSLIDAYSRVKELIRSPDRLPPLLGLKEDEGAVVAHQVLEAINGMAAPHLIVGQVLRHLIFRNGLLLNRSALMARLGVEMDSPDQDNLCRALDEEGIGYAGILASGWRRWWAHRLVDYFRCDLARSDFFSLGAASRVTALNEVFKLKMKPAHSRWTKRDDALVTFACASCDRPTEMAVSVAAYDPYPHSFGERMRICYACISNGEYEDRDLQVDERDEFALSQLKSGKLKPPA